jgi:hypothetical protein
MKSDKIHAVMELSSTHILLTTHWSKQTENLHIIKTPLIMQKCIAFNFQSQHVLAINGHPQLAEICCD